MNIAALREAGIQYEAGIARFMGNERIYERVLTAFVSDDTMARAQTAFLDNDREALEGCVHELKGVSGNLEITKLYAACVALVALLRAGAAEDDEVAARFAVVETTYALAREGIERALQS